MSDDLIKNNDINWQQLQVEAQQVSDNAYAPYSHFCVGASLEADNGQIFSGCNVENASYGLTVCAERNCIATAVAQGVRHFKAIMIFTAQEQLTPPCGACRQVIAEFMPADGVVGLVNHLGKNKQWKVSDLLPEAFTPSSLQNATKI